MTMPFEEPAGGAADPPLQAGSPAPRLLSLFFRSEDAFRVSSSLRRGVAHPLELARDRFVLESVGSSGSVGMRASSPWVIIHGWRFRPLRVMRLLGFLAAEHV